MTGNGGQASIAIDLGSALDVGFLHLFMVFVIIYNVTVGTKQTFVLEIKTYHRPKDLFRDS